MFCALGPGVFTVWITACPQNGSCEGTGEGLPRALPQAVMEQDLECGEIEEWGPATGGQVAGGGPGGYGPKRWEPDLKCPEMRRVPAGPRGKALQREGQTVSERSLQGLGQWGEGKQPRVELSQEAGCRRPAPPESCRTRQEMPLLPGQHLGCLEGSLARERSPWAPWCHQWCQGTELGSLRPQGHQDLARWPHGQEQCQLSPRHRRGLCRKHTVQRPWPTHILSGGALSSSGPPTVSGRRLWGAPAAPKRPFAPVSSELEKSAGERITHFHVAGRGGLEHTSRRTDWVSELVSNLVKDR